jgi:hypothetical protein
MVGRRALLSQIDDTAVTSPYPADADETSKCPIEAQRRTRCVPDRRAGNGESKPPTARRDALTCTFSGRTSPRAARIAWADIKGMRNHLAHRYFETAHAIVADTATADLPPLVEDTERLLAGLNEQPDDGAKEPQRLTPSGVSCQIRARTRGGEEATAVPNGNPQLADLHLCAALRRAQPSGRPSELPCRFDPGHPMVWRRVEPAGVGRPLEEFPGNCRHH